MDVGIVQASALPLESHNGDMIPNILAEHIKMIVLCASALYSVVGSISDFGKEPGLLADFSHNTRPGNSLINILTDIPTSWFMGRKHYPELKKGWRTDF